MAARVARSVGRGHVLAVDAGALLGQLEAAAVHELEPPGGEAIALPDAAFDAALVGGLGSATPLAIALALSTRVRAGGSITFALPTTRAGLKGATGSLVGLLRRRRPVLLEDLCEALLLAGLHTVEACELDDPAGTSVVTARLRSVQYST